MKSHSKYCNRAICELVEQYPFLSSYLTSIEFKVDLGDKKTFYELTQLQDEDWYENKGTTSEDICTRLDEHVKQMLAFLGEDEEKVISITILPGFDKSGIPETFESIKIKSGEITSIVGPTGSGKSRLLADIEWVSQGDTPTKRKILLNDNTPDPKWRFSPMHKLVAQLSQNMNFVMDVEVGEFLLMHAQSRMVDAPEEKVDAILEAANKLAGESFDSTTQLTGLSGGQSRSLMIADTAILSKSPIVLIDEIENAGIDRQKALDLLVAEDKIVLMATHDPILALMGHRRIVIGNGGITSVIETSEKEKNILSELVKMDAHFQTFRHQLRNGQILQK